MSWVVIDRLNAVYAAWVNDCEPTLDDEQEMLTWFDYLEGEDTPPSVDDESEGFPVTTGTNGERVTYVLIPNPDQRDSVRGAIVLKRIECAATDQ